LIEKIIPLDDISLVEFLGQENKNLNRVSAAFPKSKIIARGNEIKLIGDKKEITLINELIFTLLEHFNRFGSLSEDKVEDYLELEGKAEIFDETGDGVVLFGNKGVSIKAKSANQRKLIDEVAKNDLVFALGPAGTGKTYVSVALAVKALKSKQVKKIIISRPAVEAGESLGFLPGDLKEKVDPYLRPIYDALEDMIPAEKLHYYKDNNVIEIAPLAYMRGRTLSSAYVLLDEAQNTTPNQLKMFLTRLGPDSKMIITGDTSQVDLPKNQKSGLLHAIDTLKNVKGVSIVHLKPIDVVRHKIVKHIIEAYDAGE
jgi:phosphate starvation-inducible PhoH-like protein